MNANFSLPGVNFGTYKLAGEECYAAVRAAIAAGYTGIDTASIYRNEEIVGRAIRDSGKNVFLTTKLSPTEMGYSEAYAAFEGNLNRLGVAQVDLLLIHWPGKARIPPESSEHRQVRLETWRALERIHQEGKARFIGVSNFTVKHLSELLADGISIKPYANQVEVHVLLQQRDLRKFCAHHGILLQAYSPLGSGGAPILELLETKTSEPLRYALHAAKVLSDSLVLKSASEYRIVKNKHVLEEPAPDLAGLESLDQGRHFCWNPDVVQ